MKRILAAALALVVGFSGCLSEDDDPAPGTDGGTSQVFLERNGGGIDCGNGTQTMDVFSWTYDATGAPGSGEESYEFPPRASAATVTYGRPTLAGSLTVEVLGTTGTRLLNYEHTGVFALGSSVGVGGRGEDPFIDDLSPGTHTLRYESTGVVSGFTLDVLATVCE